MDIYYTNKTLYVNLTDEINPLVIEHMQKRVFNILDDYEIGNIELIVGECDNNLFNNFITTYKSKYNGNLKIK